MTRTSAILLGGFVTGLVAASCAPEPQLFVWEDHCAQQTGDVWCAERYDGSRPFCVRGTCGPTPGRDGCVEQRPAEDECYSPCGGALSFPDDSTCIEEESTGSTGTIDPSSTTAETDTESTTGPVPCSSDDDCSDASAPFCEPSLGECVACSGTAEPDAACAGVDSSAPVCLGDVCVQCTEAATEACTGETPICDGDANTCIGCTEHAQCGEAACNLYTGACLPADAVVHVGPGQDFTVLGAAVADFDAETEGTIIVHQSDYLEAVTIDGGRVIAFLAADGEFPSWSTPGASTAPQITVAADATVFVDQLRVSNNGASSSPGILVDGGRAWIDRSRVVSNVGGAIAVQSDGEMTARNCFLGGDVNDRGALNLTGSTATVLYSVLAAGFGAASSVACDKTSSVQIRNAILVSRATDPEVQCDGATVDYSATESELGGTNTTVGDMDLTWFADFAGGDFHLGLVPPVLVNAGQWREGDPAVDIDGQLRPDVDGSPDVPGADVP